MAIVITLLLIFVPPQSGKTLTMKDLAPLTVMMPSHVSVVVATVDGKPVPVSLSPPPTDDFVLQAYDALREQGTLFPKIMKPVKLASVDPSEPVVAVVVGDSAKARQNKTLMAWLKKLRHHDRAVLWLDGP